MVRRQHAMMSGVGLVALLAVVAVIALGIYFSKCRKHLRGCKDIKNACLDVVTGAELGELCAHSKNCRGPCGFVTGVTGVPATCATCTASCVTKYAKVVGAAASTS